MDVRHRYRAEAMPLARSPVEKPDVAGAVGPPEGERAGEHDQRDRDAALEYLLPLIVLTPPSVLT
jgi:hypothetical protein